MAAKVLTGETKASDLAYETIKDYQIYTNENALENLNISLPEAIKEKTVPVELD